MPRPEFVQLTDAETQALTALLDRVHLSNLLGALAILCIDRAQASTCGTDTIAWNDLAVRLTTVEQAAARTVG